MSIGSLIYRFRVKYGHGLRVAYYRDVVRPRILQTPPVEGLDDRRCEIHVLTSQQDWLNLIWALKSFYAASGRKYELCIHDDGSLEQSAQEENDAEGFQEPVIPQSKCSVHKEGKRYRN